MYSPWTLAGLGCYDSFSPSPCLSPCPSPCILPAPSLALLPLPFLPSLSQLLCSTTWAQSCPQSWKDRRVERELSIFLQNVHESLIKAQVKVSRVCSAMVYYYQSVYQTLLSVVHSLESEANLSCHAHTHSILSMTIADENFISDLWHPSFKPRERT